MLTEGEGSSDTDGTNESSFFISDIVSLKVLVILLDSSIILEAVCES